MPYTDNKQHICNCIYLNQLYKNKLEGLNYTSQRKIKAVRFSFKRESGVSGLAPPLSHAIEE